MNDPVNSNLTALSDSDAVEDGASGREEDVVVNYAPGPMQAWANQNVAFEPERALGANHRGPRILVGMWPTDPEALIELQRQLAVMEPKPWRPGTDRPAVGGCFVCFPRGYQGPGAEGDRAFAAAALLVGRRRGSPSVVEGWASGPYEPGLLAIREGLLLETAVRGLPSLPDVLLVNATGRDHPRRAGLAVHLGAVLDVPTVGVTHRPLLAEGEWPLDEPGAASQLRYESEIVGAWLRTRPGRRPLAVHAGWRTDPEVATEVARLCRGRHRTPAPLREARRLARSARASAAV